MKKPISFTNRFLIAMPTMQDPFFTKSVVYLYEHSDKGAMGIVINKPFQVTIKNLLQHLDIPINDEAIANIEIYSGGPVSPEQGFVLHDQKESDEHNEHDILISSSKEMLERIAQGSGPEHFIIALGYAAWEAGQLEKEIHRNDWLIAPAKKEIVFSTPLEKRWETAAELLGIDINQLGGQIGHA